MVDWAGRLEELERRVHLLESELSELRTTVETPAAFSRPVRPEPVPNWPAPRLAAPPPLAGGVAAPRSMEIGKEAVLKWGGVGLVVLAVGFAVSTAIHRGWIGPELQLIGALAVGLALIGTGLRLWPTRPRWTHALCSGGVLALYTTVASDLFIDQTTDAAALVATAVIAAGGYAISRRVPSEWVGIGVLCGGAIGSAAVARGDLALTWNLILVAGIVAAAIGLALEQRWFALRLLAHGVGLLRILAAAVDPEGTSAQVLVLLLGAALYVSLARIPSVGDLSSTWQQLEMQLVAVAAPWGLTVLAATLELSGETAVGSVALAVAAGTVVVALALRRRIHQAHFVSLLIGASVTSSIGLAVLLSTTAAFLALAVQGAGLVLLSRALGGSLRVLVNAAVVLVIAVLFVVVEMLDAWADNASIGDDVAHLVIVAAVGVAAWQSRRRPVQGSGAAVVLGLLLLWLGSVLDHLPQGQAAVSVSWAVVGTVVLVIGVLRKVPEFGAAGMIVLALTVGKLLTVDLQALDTLWRAGLFLAVGLGLMRLGFVLPRLTGAAEERESTRG